MSFADNITDVRGTQEERDHVDHYIRASRLHMNESTAGYQDNPPQETWPICRVLSDAIIGGIDTLGSVLFSSLLMLRGFRTYKVDALCPITYIHGKGKGKYPPLIISCGLGSTHSDYILLAFKCLGYFKSVTIIDPPGSNAGKGSIITAETASCAFASLMDEVILSMEDRPIVVGHSLGARFVLDYLMGRSGIAYGAGLNQTSSATTSDLSSPLVNAKPLCHAAHRVLAIALIAPMGAPFISADLNLMSSIYRCDTWDSASLIVRGASGGGRDPIMTGATWKRLRHNAAQALIHSALFTQSIPKEKFAAIRVPVAICWGYNDKLIPPEQLLFFAQNIPNSTPTIIKLLPKLNHQNWALGHGPAVRQLLRFVERVVAADAAAKASLPSSTEEVSPIEISRRFSTIQELAYEKDKVEDARDDIQPFDATNMQ
jgi:pimeloyl-ACP methyl ester carboxylesterase